MNFFSTDPITGAVIPSVPFVGQAGFMLRPPVLVMGTGVNAVTAGGARAGWVSGTPASLAASGSVNVVFDLGPDWAQYILVQTTVRSESPSSGLDQVRFSGNDVPVLTGTRYLRDMQSSAGTVTWASVTTANAAGTFMVRPMGRYLIVAVHNADASNAQGPTTSITLAAYPS